MDRHSKSTRSAAGILVAVVLTTVALGYATAGEVALTLIRISVDGGGHRNNASSTAVNPDGRFIVYSSFDQQLAEDNNGRSDVYLRELLTGMLERVSLGNDGAQGDGDSFSSGGISTDGRFVAFSSAASNFVAGGDANASQFDAFVRDRLTGITELVSRSSDGEQGNKESFANDMSADGRYVVFQSRADNLVAGDTNGEQDIFVRDRNTGTTRLVSVGAAGAPADRVSFDPSISADGRFVAFASLATNLVAGDTNATTDVFVRDLLSETTERVSIGSGGQQGDGVSGSPSTSGDGRWVAFFSSATNLVANDTNAKGDVFVRDRLSGVTQRVSVATDATQGDGMSISPAISGNGRIVAFLSRAGNLDPGETDAFDDIYLHDRWSATTSLVTRVPAGAVPVLRFGRAGLTANALNDDGTVMVFAARHNGLVAGDIDDSFDAFAAASLANLPPSANAGPDQTLECTSTAGATALLDGSGSADPDGDPLTFTWMEAGAALATGRNASVVLALGTHPITLTVMDTLGATGSDATLIDVVDTSAPSILASGASPDRLWPPNKTLRDVAIEVDVADTCAAQAACRITGVRSDEPVDPQSPDWVITGELTLKLRAQRDGAGDGRTYTITVECVDSSGNASVAEIEVEAPHDQG